jgi:SAM-dependent methyltransferase
MPAEQPHSAAGGRVLHRPVSDAETRRANRAEWDADADAYQAEHGEFLGDARFVWSPEGLDEAAARLLGDVAGQRVLEVGCGAGQCARWLRGQGAQAYGMDLSMRQLAHSARLDAKTGIGVPVACASADRLPFANGSFDAACSAFGALPFVADVSAVFGEVARVLRPGGRWVFSVTHPMRWMLPDDPSEAGLVVGRSYFDRTPYVEEDANGAATYVEHHRTMGDWVRALVTSGFTLEALVEPEWPPWHQRVWGAWGPVRGALVPGTAIFVTRLPEWPAQ